MIEVFRELKKLTVKSIFEKGIILSLYPTLSYYKRACAPRAYVYDSSFAYLIQREMFKFDHTHFLEKKIGNKIVLFHEVP